MAVLPKYKRIRKEDFPKDAQDIVDRLAFSINDGFANLFSALTGKLTFGDNILSAFRDITVTVNSAGTPTTSVSAALPDGVTNPKGVIVVQASNQTNNNVYPTGTPFISYTVNNKSLIINNIAGLPANNTFELKILIIG